MLRRSRRERGISLIEALVAFAVMSFGMLAVVGLQSSLRLNADVAKQRSEAVRIAQEAVERGRSFSALTSTAGQSAYEDISDSEQEVDDYTTTNTTYILRQSVTDHSDQRLKTLVVDVEWTDRSGASQGVQMTTSITGVAPELGGSLGLPGEGGPTQQPRGRHRDIPPAAVDQGDGTSRFEPPGAEGVSWVFNNLTGIITNVCTAPETCPSANARLLTGFVQFATMTTQPSTADAESPPGTAFPLQVVVNQSAPFTDPIACYETPPLSYIVYYCAVPVTEAEPRWSGRSVLEDLPVAIGAADTATTKFRVCRYTPVGGCQPAVDSVIWGMPNSTASCTEPDPQTAPPTPGRIMRNSDHPLDYDQVAGALTNQNFLVIVSGIDPETRFHCPGDDPLTPFINGNTWSHQPTE